MNAAVIVRNPETPEGCCDACGRHESRHHPGCLTLPRPVPVELARLCDFLMDAADALVSSYHRGPLADAVWFELGAELRRRLDAAEGACRG